jgi:type II secretory pathway pseudopilin PulG
MGKTRMINKNPPSCLFPLQAGFSLIEVTFAILILAGSLIVLLGLQSSTMERAVRDGDRQQAMLMARQILTAVEVAKDPIQEEEKQGSVDQIFQEVASQGLSKGGERLDSSGRFQAQLTVRNWPLPLPDLADQKLVKKIELIISWGSSSIDSFTVTYFVPEPPPEDPTA